LQVSLTPTAGSNSVHFDGTKHCLSMHFIHKFLSYTILHVLNILLLRYLVEFGSSILWRHFKNLLETLASIATNWCQVYWNCNNIMYYGIGAFFSQKSFVWVIMDFLGHQVTKICQTKKQRSHCMRKKGCN
jgi:hypothetical protein